MKLALFDLDHTLIPFDSGMAWTRFLVERGILPAEAEPRYLAYCHRYVAGTLDLRAMHRASVAPLQSFSCEQVAAWGAQFEARMAPLVPPSMLALVRRHQRSGDLCAIVTATTRFIAEPFGRLFGLDAEAVLATEPATAPWPGPAGDVAFANAAPEGAETRPPEASRRYTGDVEGEPCFGEHKLAHVTRWLGGRGTRLAAFDETWFYSDSASDLALLSAVSHPVAVAPDERLRAHAEAHGWRVMTRGD